MGKFDDLKDDNNLNTFLGSLFARANPENNNQITNTEQLKFVMNTIAKERNLELLKDEDAKELYKMIKNDEGPISIDLFREYFKELL